MKNVAMATVVSLAAILIGVNSAKAAGLIVVDPGLMPHLVPVTPRNPVSPIFISPIGHLTHPPLLRGSISYGLHLQSEEIKVNVADQVAKTYITQTFVNDTDRNLAGTYLFPLPDDTTFSSFSLHIDGKPVEGKILEANEARQQYEEIVRRMVDPGLLEYADYKTVRARIFPIPAHGTKKVELEYTQILRAENGLLKYQFPLKAQGETPAVDKVKIDVKIASKQGLRTIWSPSHEINSSKLNDNQAKVAFAAANLVPEKDFILYYSVSDKEMAANLLTHKNSDEDGYFLLTLSPPVKGQKIIGKDIVLAVDTSGSMQGEKIEETKKALKYIINALDAQDRFSLLQFNTDVDQFRSGLMPATAENKNAALSFVDDLEANGGTNIGDALHTGVNLLNEASTRPAYLVLLTDGEPTVGETNINQLAKAISSKRDIRLFDFGVGYSVNTRLLNKMAEENHGTAQYVEPSENIETALANFYRKIKSPVLNDVKLSFIGMQVRDVYPKEVKDIFAGTQVILIGKYKSAAKGTLDLTGKVNGIAKTYSFPLTFPVNDPDHTYLPRLWAMRRIGHLTEIAQDNHENREVIDEIVALSKKYGIISAYTSFLVTDPAENHRLPVNAVGFATPMRMNVDSGGALFNPGGNMAGFGGNTTVHGAPVAGQFQALGAQASAPTDNASALAQSKSYNKPASEIQSVVTRSFAAAGNMEFDKQLKEKFAASLRQGSNNGQLAVSRAKKVDQLKTAYLSQDEKVNGIKNVEDKTFYLANGFWTDSGYNPSVSSKIEQITFGSQSYFKLLHDHLGISKYLAVGQQVILIFKGHCYKIVMSVIS